MDVFINDVAAFLPNDPVTNGEIENVLGKIDNIPSKTKRLVLKNNKIESRYYAIDRETGELTHSNAGMTAEAVRKLSPYDGFSPNEIQCLCCGTTVPDIIIPGHALMVAGELGLSGCEASTSAGICISGMLALKYAYMNVAMNYFENAVATGSDLASSVMRAKFFSSPSANLNTDIEENPILSFDADFLRWMLSDGAGSVFLSRNNDPDRISLRIDWIENITLAGDLETCMYSGGLKKEDGSMIGWRETEAIESRSNLFYIRQDIKLLGREIVPSMQRVLSRIIKKDDLVSGEIDWFLPHYSSWYFRDKFYNAMKEIDFEIPYEKWFTNLKQKGNTGSAAIYIILEELFHSGDLEPGQKILCFIPESGRFTHCFMHLTVV